MVVFRFDALVSLSETPVAEPGGHPVGAEAVEHLGRTDFEVHVAVVEAALPGDRHYLLDVSFKMFQVVQELPPPVSPQPPQNRTVKTQLQAVQEPLPSPPLSGVRTVPAAHERAWKKVRRAPYTSPLSRSTTVTNRGSAIFLKTLRNVLV